MKYKWLVILGIVIVIIFSGFSWVKNTYNGLTTEKVNVDAKWAQVENTYQSRFDLTPQLEATVKGAADFEKSTFVEIAQARSQWQAAKASDDRVGQMAAANQLDSSVARFMITVENYPTLSGTQTFATMQAQVEGLDNRLRVARKDYTDAAQVFNTKVKIFPGILLANILGFKEEPFFESTQGAEIAPVIDFAK